MKALLWLTCVCALVAAVAAGPCDNDGLGCAVGEFCFTPGDVAGCVALAGGGCETNGCAAGACPGGADDNRNCMITACTADGAGCPNGFYCGDPDGGVCDPVSAVGAGCEVAGCTSGVCAGGEFAPRSCVSDAGTCAADGSGCVAGFYCLGDGSCTPLLSSGAGCEDNPAVCAGASVCPLTGLEGLDCVDPLTCTKDGAGCRAGAFFCVDPMNGVCAATALDGTGCGGGCTSGTCPVSGLSVDCVCECPTECAGGTDTCNDAACPDDSVCAVGQVCHATLGSCCTPSRACGVCSGGDDGCGWACPTAAEACDPGWVCVDDACADPGTCITDGTGCNPGFYCVNPSTGECKAKIDNTGCSVYSCSAGTCQGTDCACLCTSACDGGLDSCGLGACPGLEVCEAGDVCYNEQCCSPDCSESQCGAQSDGCGGTCPGPEFCSPDAQCLSGICVSVGTCATDGTGCLVDAFCHDATAGTCMQKGSSQEGCEADGVYACADGSVCPGGNSAGRDCVEAHTCDAAGDGCGGGFYCKGGECAALDGSFAGCEVLGCNSGYQCPGGQSTGRNCMLLDGCDALGIGCADGFFCSAPSGATYATPWPSALVPSPPQVTSMALGDVSGDGVPDLLFTSTAATAVMYSVFDTATSHFLPAVAIDTTLAMPRWVSVGSIDNNAHLDVVVASFASSKITYYLGLGGGAFDAGVDVVTGLAAAVFVDLVDVDRDGNNDLVYASDTTMEWRAGVGNGLFAPPTQIGSGGATHMVLADMDGDTFVDVVMASAGGVYMYKNLGGGYGSPTDIVTGFSADALVVGDLNGDGRLDVVGSSLGVVGIVFQEDLGVYADIYIPYAVPIPASELFLFDFQRDGALDVAFSHASGTVGYLPNAGNGLFVGGDYTLFNVPTPGRMIFADLDMDGTINAVVANTLALPITHATADFLLDLVECLPRGPGGEGCEVLGCKGAGGCPAELPGTNCVDSGTCDASGIGCHPEFFCDSPGTGENSCQPLNAAGEGCGTLGCSKGSCTAGNVQCACECLTECGGGLDTCGEAACPDETVCAAGEVCDARDDTCCDPDCGASFCGGGRNPCDSGDCADWTSCGPTETCNDLGFCVASGQCGADGTGCSAGFYCFQPNQATGSCKQEAVGGFKCEVGGCGTENDVGCNLLGNCAEPGTCDVHGSGCNALFFCVSPDIGLGSCDPLNALGQGCEVLGCTGVGQCPGGSNAIARNCEHPGTCATACQPGFYCADPENPTSLSSCAPTTADAAGEGCQTQACVTGVCTDPTMTSVDADCVDTTCSPDGTGCATGTYCKAPLAGTCAARAGGDGCQSLGCTGTAVCDTVSGNCVDGGTCDLTGLGCSVGFYCHDPTNGACEFVGPGGEGCETLGCAEPLECPTAFPNLVPVVGRNCAARGSCDTGCSRGFYCRDPLNAIDQACVAGECTGGCTTGVCEGYNLLNVRQCVEETTCGSCADGFYCDDPNGVAEPCVPSLDALGCGGGGCASGVCVGVGDCECLCLGSCADNDNCGNLCPDCGAGELCVDNECCTPTCASACSGEPDNGCNGDPCPSCTGPDEVCFLGGCCTVVCNDDCSGVAHACGGNCPGPEACGVNSVCVDDTCEDSGTCEEGDYNCEADFYCFNPGALDNSCAVLVADGGCETGGCAGAYPDLVCPGGSLVDVEDCVPPPTCGAADSDYFYCYDVVGDLAAPLSATDGGCEELGCAAGGGCPPGGGDCVDPGDCLNGCAADFWCADVANGAAAACVPMNAGLEGCEAAAHECVSGQCPSGPSGASCVDPGNCKDGCVVGAGFDFYCADPDKGIYGGCAPVIAGEGCEVYGCLSGFCPVGSSIDCEPDCNPPCAANENCQGLVCVCQPLCTCCEPGCTDGCGSSCACGAGFHCHVDDTCYECGEELTCDACTAVGCTWCENAEGTVSECRKPEDCSGLSTMFPFTYDCAASGAGGAGAEETAEGSLLTGTQLHIENVPFLGAGELNVRFAANAAQEEIQQVVVRVFDPVALDAAVGAGELQPTNGITVRDNFVGSGEVLAVAGADYSFTVDIYKQASGERIEGYYEAPYELEICNLLVSPGQDVHLRFFDRVTLEWKRVGETCPIELRSESLVGGCYSVLGCHASQFALFFTSAVGSGIGDPHFEGFYGGSFDFMGEAGKVYNLFSDRELQMNARFGTIDGLEGTYIDEIGLRLGSQNTIRFARHGVVQLNPMMPDPVQANTWRLHGGVARWNTSSLVVEYDAFRVWLTRYRSGDLHYEEHGAQGDSIGYKITFDEEALTAGERYPHGILGQTALVHRVVVPVPHTKQGEGVIEGHYSDYEIRSGDIMGTDFVFNQFAPQQVSDE